MLSTHDILLKDQPDKVSKLEASTYLFLPDLASASAKSRRYLISMAPMNSSGDLYHIVTYIILTTYHGKEVPDILLTYDGRKKLVSSETAMNTYTQVHRSLAFSRALDYGQHFATPVHIDMDDCYQQKNRKARFLAFLQNLVPSVSYIDQKILTALIAYHYYLFGWEKTTRILRKGYQQRNTKIVPANISNQIDKRVDNEVAKITKHAAEKPIILLHIRYSSKANGAQNISATSFVNQVIAFLESKGYATWCIFADGRRSGSFVGVGNRTDPFPLKLRDTKSGKTSDYGKLFHLQLLHRLHDLPRLHGMIGNTSGTLDVAAFVGHRVYNIHYFNSQMQYQDYRICIQSAFLNVEFVNPNTLRNELKDAGQVKGKLTDKIVKRELPNLLNWLEEDTETTSSLPESVATVKKSSFDTDALKELFFISSWQGSRSRKTRVDEPIPIMGETVKRLSRLSN